MNRRTFIRRAIAAAAAAPFARAAATAAAPVPAAAARAAAPLYGVDYTGVWVPMSKEMLDDLSVKREQATIVYNAAAAMVRQSPRRLGLD